MNKPLVSVIVPVYNGQEYLVQCLDSILAQTYPNIEIVIVNDSSSDNSHDIIVDYLHRYSNIIYLINDSRLGLARTKSRGFDASKGFLLSSVDCDDLIDTTKIENEFNLWSSYFDKHGSPCVSFSIVSFIDSFDRVFYRHPHKSVREGFLLFPLLSRSLAFVPRDFLISRDQYIHSGGFHPESILYVDWVFKLRLALYYPYVCTYAPGTLFRKHSSPSMSKYSLGTHFKALLLGFTSIYKHLSFPKRVLSLLLFYTNVFLHLFKHFILRRING